MISEALMFTLMPRERDCRDSGAPDGLLRQVRDLAEERVGGGEPERDTRTDDERRVDQAGEQEHLRLQFVHQLGLARGRLEVLAAHDADADTGADGTQTDDQAGGEGNKANDFHGDSYRGF